MFLNSICLRLMKIQDKSATRQISSVQILRTPKGLVNTLIPEEWSETGAFCHLINHSYRSQELRKYLSYEGDIFFQKCTKFHVHFKNAKKNLHKTFLVSEIIVSEPIARTSPNYDENACDMQSTFYQRIPRFQISLREIFSNSICLGLTKNQEESAAGQISSVLRTRGRDDSRRVLGSRGFRSYK